MRSAFTEEYFRSMAFGTRHCYVCDADNVDKKSFAQHMKDHSQDLEKFKFSNSSSDYCRTLCKICGKAFQITTMRQHTKNDHNMVITEYKKKYNQEYFDIVQKVFHKCGLCHLPLLLDSDVVAVHLKTSHTTTHKEYNLNYMVLQQQSRGPRKRKSEELKVVKYPDVQLKTVETPKEVEESHPAIRSTVPPEKEEHRALIKSGESLRDEELVVPETISDKDDVKMGSKEATEDNFVDVDSNQQQSDHLLSEEKENTFEGNSLSIESFRSFIASITEPGSSPLSYPAIERILAMEVANFR